eukprot:CAMPEP_0174233644 /NCGR_PEP_ID=MMETSP0417-20130205/3626_1 /TAXON_ID=242541 /ORGANISM="Mayorella sp, Strain BSH-02190019" /LENGTH=73 /DNA_ID=CAMNT_0015311885 /DNA_START=7 /DNA_END=225 /DNA_ORIENTATION=+
MLQNHRWPPVDDRPALEALVNQVLERPELCTELYDVLRAELSHLLGPEALAPLPYKAGAPVPSSPFASSSSSP